MTVYNCIYMVLLIYSFQYYISADKHSTFFQREIEDALIDLIQQSQHKLSINYDETSKPFKYDVDPDDRVDVENWNKLNDADLKIMPQTKDYSNENAARKWLDWYLPVSERYNQVNE